MLHTLRWGPDGLLYMNQSIYIHSHIETPLRRAAAERRRHLAVPPGDAASWRCSAAGFVNPWGHHFDRWGQSFATDGAYGEGINYVFPGRGLRHGARRDADRARASTPAARSTAAWRSSAAGICPTTGRAT